MLYYQSGAATQTGKRGNNQDNYYLNGIYNQEVHTDCTDKKSGQGFVALFAVADGMGGEQCGEKASFLLSDRLSNITPQAPSDMPGIVERAILDVNETLCAIMKKENTGRIGSTVVSLLYADPFVYISNLGDSPAYLYRNGILEKLTRDHTEGQAMLDGGVFSKDQLAHHSSRNRLTRHLGIFPSEMVLEVEQYPAILPREGDIFLLCSDGVNGTLPNDKLGNCLATKKNAAEVSEAIVTEAIDCGSRDNCTALVVKFSDRPFPEASIKQAGEQQAITAVADEIRNSDRGLIEREDSDSSIERTEEVIPFEETKQKPKTKNEKNKVKKRKAVILFIVLLCAEVLLLGCLSWWLFMMIAALR